ncbi:MAG: BrnT family toxin [Hydrogenovibrio sp.]
MNIEYDHNKNKKNIKERGLSFERFLRFDLSTAKVIEDTRYPYPEKRYQVYGVVEQRLYVAVITPITGGVRVISLRKANKREVKKYGE